MNLIRCLLVLLSTTLFACTDAPQLSPLQSSDRILAFGDSLTFGYGAKPQQSYPAVLSELTGLEVINAGVSGEISAKGLQRLPALLDKHQPHLLILCHGANDMLQKRDLSVMQENLETMIAMAQERGIEVLLLAVPQTNLLLTPLPQYAQVAEKTQVAFNEDLFSDILARPSLHSDLIHPNAEGYREIAIAIKAQLEAQGAL